MKNIVLMFALVIGFTFAVNAQSKDCCSKEKGETTKVEKCSKNDHTMKSGDNSETTTTTTSSLTDDKQKVEKEVVVVKTKMDKKENCDEPSSCCDMKKEKKIEKIEKNIEKKQ